ncbi:helix-turn-helix domain-containing protein [Nocardia lijiangensis]|uniref:helix-turn-helix domain-containing protein n=1 Tax=Nocardia lijiangensis TaxID=299618 RepID=UPI003D734377
MQQITRTSKQPVRVRRAIVVLASAQGQPVALICRLLRVSESYVRQVIHDFNEKGFPALGPNGTGQARRLGQRRTARGGAVILEGIVNRVLRTRPRARSRQLLQILHTRRFDGPSTRQRKFVTGHGS